MATSNHISAAESAAQYCSVMHIHRSHQLGFIAPEIAMLLGLPLRDDKWVTPLGNDVSGLVACSVDGGFSSTHWSLKGWVLDEGSMAALRLEFPAHFLEDL